MRPLILVALASLVLSSGCKSRTSATLPDAPVLATGAAVNEKDKAPATVIQASYSSAEDIVANQSASGGDSMPPVNWDDQPLDLELKEEFQSGVKVTLQGVVAPGPYREAPQKDFLRPWYDPEAESARTKALDDAKEK